MNTTRMHGRPRTTPTRTFQIDPDLWEEFNEVAAEHNRSRGGHLRYLVQEAVDEHKAAKAA